MEIFSTPLPVIELRTAAEQVKRFPITGKTISQGDIEIVTLEPTSNNTAITYGLGSCIGLIAYTNTSLQTNTCLFAHIDTPENLTERLKEKLKELSGGRTSDLYIHLGGALKLPGDQDPEERGMVTTALQELNIPAANILDRWSNNGEASDMAIMLGLQAAVIHKFVKDY